MYKVLRNKLKDSNAVFSPSTNKGRQRGRCVGMTLTLLLSLLLLTGSTNQATAATPVPLKAAVTSAAVISPQHNPSSFSTDPFNMDINDRGTGEKHVTCYPNPAISYINFKFDKSVPKNARLFVFSFTGRKMTELAINGTVQKITLEDYYRGLYVYQLRSASGAILESGKFQVKN